MSAIDKTPTNKNFLSPINFTFVLKRSPLLNFFVQKINIPSIDLGTFNQPSPLLNIPYAGDHLNYSEFQVEFKVDENFTNYLEIHNWIKGLAYPENQEQYAALSRNPKESGESIKSDISVIIADGLKNPNFEITFTDAFPISLSGLEFDTRNSDVDYITSAVTFKYTYYNIIKL
jgi:hypothetical protein